MSEQLDTLSLKDHFRSNMDLYLVILSWAGAAAVLPNVGAIIWSILSFLFIMRTGDSSKLLIALLAMLILSDSRMQLFRFAETAKIGVVVLLGLHILRNFKSYSSSDNRIFKYFLPFLIFSVIATLWAPGPFTAFQKSISYGLIYLSVPLLFVQALKQNKNLGYDLVVFFTLILGVGLALYFFNPALVALQGRYSGIMGNPNGLGLILLLMFPLSYLFWLQHKERLASKQIIWMFLAVFAYSLFLSGSRTAIFSLLIFFGFSRLRYFTNWATILGFVVLVISFEYVFAQLPSIIHSLGLDEYLRVSTLQEGSGRNVAWQFGWSKVDDVFFAGGGFGYTERVFFGSGEHLSRLGHQGNAHNSYLTIWLDTGLIGLSLFVIGLLRTIAAGIRTSSYTLPVVYALLFSTYFESWLAASLNPYTSILLITLTFLAQEDQEFETAPVVDEEKAKPSRFGGSRSPVSSLKVKN